MSMFLGSIGAGSGGSWLPFADRKLALSNRVTGNESPEQLLAIHKEDKALDQAINQGKMNDEYMYAWRESALTQYQKNRDQKRRLIQNGSIFV